MKSYAILAAICAGFFMVVGSLLYGVAPAAIGAVAVAALILLIGKFKTRNAVAPPSRSTDPPAV